MLFRSVEERRSVDTRSGYLERVVLKSNGAITLLLKDGTELTLSRAYRSQVEAWLRQAI